MQGIITCRGEIHSGVASTPRHDREGGPDARHPVPGVPPNSTCLEIQSKPKPGATVTASIINDASHTAGHTRYARDDIASNRESTCGCNR